jgi:ferredoxin-NADP reductase
VALDAAALQALVPDVRRRDTYVCGPEAFTDTLAGSLHEAGVTADRIHFESFAF